MGELYLVLVARYIDEGDKPLVGDVKGI